MTALSSVSQDNAICKAAMPATLSNLSLQDSIVDVLKAFKRGSGASSRTELNRHDILNSGLRVSVFQAASGYGFILMAYTKNFSVTVFLDEKASMTSILTRLENHFAAHMPERLSDSFIQAGCWEKAVSYDKDETK